MPSYLFEDNFEKALREEALPFVNRDSMVLNLACEFSRVPQFLTDKLDPKNVFGLEINQDVIAKDDKILHCNLNQDVFPFPDNHFDLVFSIWGIEHFKTDNFFQEARRVLKRGGKFIFIVPNLAHPVFLANKLAQGKAGKFYYKYVLHSAYHPTVAYYHFNTLGKITQVAKKFDFKVNKLIFLGPANILLYFSFSRLLQGVTSLMEKMITNKFLYKLKPYIITVLEK